MGEWIWGFPSQQTSRNFLAREYGGISAKTHGAEYRAPASFEQLRLWFMQQMLSSSAVFNLNTALRITIPFDVRVLETALNEIVRRHETLRTTFATDVNEEVVQVIRPHASVSLPITDLAGLPSAGRDEEAFRLASEEARTGFDLECGPLLRTRLLRLGREEHIFLLTMHHIVSDAWSMGIFWKELKHFWTALGRGQLSPLPDLPFQYSDYAVWQRKTLADKSMDQQLAYWKRKLADVSVLDLSFGRPRPAVQTFRGAHYRFTASFDLLKALQSASMAEGTTLFVTLFSVFVTLLSRLSGQMDVAVGTYVAGRNDRELEKLIGFFLNTLVLRVDLSGNPTFSELLRRVRTVTIDALANQEVPFATLIEEIKPKRDLSRNPLFQVLFQLLNVPTLKDIAEGPKPQVLDIDRATAVFDLSCTLQETSEGLVGEMEYNTEIFDRDSIERLSELFVRLLESFVRKPSQRISEAALMPPSEEYRVITEWNRTDEAVSVRSIVEEFEKEVKQGPERVAFRCRDNELSYGALDTRANQLANYLVGLGVGPEVVVGVCLERSLDSIIALFAVLKAGGAFLPLDPAYPKERLCFVIQHSKAPVIITRTALSAGLPHSGLTIVHIDAEHEQIAKCKSESPGRVAKSSDLAYVIYTSGSTGTPKGVAVEHSQILNRFHWMWERYPFAPDEVCCQKTGLGFVDSIWEVFGAVLKGIPTVIIPDDVLHETDTFVRALREHAVTRIWLVPSLLLAMLEVDSDLQQLLPCLKFWVSSGEALPPELWDRFRHAMPHAVLFNLYGTSEVWDVTWYDTRGAQAVGQRVPIGRPISNVQTYILDARLNPVPVGGTGELFVGGFGLARGYLHDPQQTAEKFLPNPFSPRAQSRIYRTGDLARWRPDGNIELLGRTDHQVKVRGYRVELNEVETAIRTHKAVRETLVALHNAGGEPLLVAFIVADGKPGPRESELRSFLRSRLPEYMVPSRFEFLESLPLTPSGKADRLALAARPLNHTVKDTAMEMSAVERTIFEAWRDVLGRDEIGINENFFDAGGHSLLMVKVFARLRFGFSANLSITHLFQYPTVSSLAAFLGEQQPSRNSFAKAQERAREQRRWATNSNR
jgi:amino acid adenylation domain-containing protein